jgi:hypothetical protein
MMPAGCEGGEGTPMLRSMARLPGSSSRRAGNEGSIHSLWHEAGSRQAAAPVRHAAGS